MKPEQYIAQALSVYFNRRALPLELSTFVRKIYNKGIPNFNRNEPIYTVEGLQIANNFNRILITDYGAYLEFNTGDILLENLIASKQKDGMQHLHKLYFSKDNSLKLYYQITNLNGSFQKGKIYVQIYDVIQFSQKTIINKEAKIKFKSPNEIQKLLKK